MLDQAAISITYSQEPTPCKKQDCDLCQAGKAHPAHWYASTLIDEMERHLYLGATFRPVGLHEFLKQESQKLEESVAPALLTDISIAEAVPSETQKTAPPSSIDTPENPLPSSQEQKEKEIVRSPEHIEKFKMAPLVEKAEIRSPEPPKIPSLREFHRDLRRFKNLGFQDVKNNYRQLIKKYHPDQFGDQNTKVQEWMKVINMAHEVHLKRMQRFIRQD